MLVPTNDIAKTVQKMQEDNVIFQEQIDLFSARIQGNNAAIEQLSPAATWEEASTASGE